MVTEEDLRKRCLALRHKCVLLRQIHSQKMDRFQRSDTTLTIGTVVVAAFLAFFGFLGLQKITQITNLIYPLSQDVVELGYNLLVFLVLLFSILNVAFQSKEKAFRHWRAINIMTDFVADIDNILAVSKLTDAEVERDIVFLNYRYKHVVDMLPPSTDADYFRAKRAIAKKEKFKLSQRKEQ
jgi:hypothetical protein